MAELPDPDKPTVELPKVPDWAIELVKLTKLVKANTDLIAGDVTGLKADVRALQKWKLETEATTVTSDRVRALATETTSHADLEGLSQLAQERAAREALSLKVDDLTSTQAVQLSILTRLDKVASNPTVKVLAGMAATAALTWFASHGGLK